jgi:LDH2 family malate/lactate/ureidoglycolate dehydrogenase
MTVITPAALKSLAMTILKAVGTDELNAEVVAGHLVSANLCGVDTHGIRTLPGYVDDIAKGYIVPTAGPTVLNESSTTALISGNWGFGQVTAKFAMERAIEKAAAANIAIVALVQVNHIGRLGQYAEDAAAKGMISMIWAGGFGEEAPAAVPYGGRTKLLHTNPIAMGFPGGEEARLMFDFATTAASGVKVLNAYRRNEPLPEGWIVDKEGNPTCTASDFYEGGGHIPFGGYKGYAFMMAAEFLGRILTGSDAHAQADRGGPIMRHQGITMIVTRPDLFQPFTDYARRADDLIRRTHAIPPAPGFKEVLVPGDPELRTRALRHRDAIPIPEDHWQELIQVTQSLGLTIPR